MKRIGKLELLKAAIVVLTVVVGVSFVGLFGVAGIAPFLIYFWLIAIDWLRDWLLMLRIRYDLWICGYGLEADLRRQNQK